MNVALIHDWLNQIGGAEDVLEVLHAHFPSAPVFTSIYDRARMPAHWQTWHIRSSWMDRLPAIHRRQQPYMPIFLAMWSLRKIPASYDVLISNKSAFCIGARGAQGSKHLCYCLTPTRFTYEFESYADRESIPTLAKPVLRMLNMLLRNWETRAAQQVTRFIAISREVQDRIKRYYKRESEIIYPPVDVSRFARLQPSRQGDYFFIVSRLLPYKRIDLAIEACNALTLPLVIAGSGRDFDRLKALAGPTVKLLGRVSDAELNQLLVNCRAFIFPGREDFGIAPIQAMACGKPVIALAAGGALDTVLHEKTGLLFDSPTKQSLIQAIQNFPEVRFSTNSIRIHAEKYSITNFVEGLDRSLAHL